MTWEEELDHWLIESLKQELRTRNASVSGKKDALAARLADLLQGEVVAPNYEYWTLTALRTAVSERDPSAGRAATMERDDAVARLAALDAKTPPTSRRPVPRGKSLTTGKAPAKRKAQEELLDPSPFKKQRSRREQAATTPPSEAPSGSQGKALTPEESSPSFQVRPVKLDPAVGRVSAVSNRTSSSPSILRSPFKRRFTPGEENKPATPTKVNFHEVQVQEYARSVAGGGGVPLDGIGIGLGWEVVARQSTPLKEYEKIRKPLRLKEYASCGNLSAQDREDLAASLGTPDLVSQDLKETEFLLASREFNGCKCKVADNGRCCATGSDCSCIKAGIQCSDQNGACLCVHEACLNDPGIGVCLERSLAYVRQTILRQHDMARLKLAPSKLTSVAGVAAEPAKRNTLNLCGSKHFSIFG